MDFSFTLIIPIIAIVPIIKKFIALVCQSLDFKAISPIMMRAFTSQDDNEIKECIETLLTTDADTGFMHESFHKDDPKKFTRSWFAWQNSLFGELILYLIDNGKLDLLNSITVR